MAFQFQCPSGHLLSSDESQAGQHSLCPMCGVMFIVPAPAGYGAGPMPYTIPAPPATIYPLPPGAPATQSQTPVNPFEALRAAAEAAEAAKAVAPPAEEAQPAPPAEPILLHIACPNGHELETPEEMLDQEVLCPHCKAQFVLRRTSSVEFKRQREEQERLREIKAGRFWLNLAIAVVVLVVLGLIGLVVARVMMQTPVTAGVPHETTA